METAICLRDAPFLSVWLQLSPQHRQSALLRRKRSAAVPRPTSADRWDQAVVAAGFVVPAGVQSFPE
jgi:hypothetical protein